MMRESHFLQNRWRGVVAVPRESSTGTMKQTAVRVLTQYTWQPIS
jgi:hypothetical protein